MNLNVYIEDDLAEEVNHLATSTGKSRNLIIREAIREYVEDHNIKPWPDTVKSFQGIETFPDATTLR